MQYFVVFMAHIAVHYFRFFPRWINACIKRNIASIKTSSTSDKEGGWLSLRVFLWSTFVKISNVWCISLTTDMTEKTSSTPYVISVEITLLAKTVDLLLLLSRPVRNSSAQRTKFSSIVTEMAKWLYIQPLVILSLLLVWFKWVIFECFS